MTTATSKSSASLIEKLALIQSELKAPKNQYNSFGKYKYRNCEDILEAVKPLLKKHGLTLLISDDIMVYGERTYVRADATITDGIEERICYGYAREPLSKKGMDESQVTGASSSYARKYALNGLFLIDDTKDADALPPQATESHSQAQKQAKPTIKTEDPQIKAKGEELRQIINQWCELNGADPKATMNGVAKRPNFEKSIEYYDAVIEEFRSDIKERSENE